MDSRWEVELAKWMDSLNIQWVRSRGMVLWWRDDTGAKRRYHPDFYVPLIDAYLDPKNKFLQKQDSDKLSRVATQNGVTLIFGLVDEIKGAIVQRLERRACTAQDGVKFLVAPPISTGM